MTQSELPGSAAPTPAPSSRFSRRSNQFYVGIFLLLVSAVFGAIAFFVPAPFPVVFGFTAVLGGLGGILRLIIASRLPKAPATIAPGSDDPQVRELTTRYLRIRVAGLICTTLMLGAVLLIIFGRSDLGLTAGLCVLAVLIACSVVARVLARRVLKRIAARRAALAPPPETTAAA